MGFLKHLILKVQSMITHSPTRKGKSAKNAQPAITAEIMGITNIHIRARRAK